MKNNRMKKIAALFLALIIGMVCLSGCGDENNNADKNNAQSATTQKVKTDKEKAAEKKKDAEKKAAEKEKAVTAKKSEDKSSSDGSGNNENNGGSSSGNTAKKSTCTVSINASEVLSSDKASDSIKSLVPSGGMLMGAKAVTIKSGDTVKDVLLRATKEAGVTVSIQGGSYVEGIGGIFEKDAGSKSGWMYSVNGTFIQDAFSDVKVYKGDTIRWQFTCNMGNDL